MYSFNIIITELCNANCTHCYMGDKKCKKTLTKNQIDTIIEKIPNNTKKIVFTGGEVLLVQDLLEYSIRILKKRFPNALIEIESNGKILYQSFDNGLKILKKLDELEVDYIRFSDDPFHAQGGIDLEKVRGLIQLQPFLKLKIKYLIQDTALAIGRAENLDNKYKKKMDCMNNENSLINPYIFIDIDGNIYTCAWKCTPKIGNIFNDSWNSIEINLKSPFQQKILSGKIEQAFSICAKNEKEIDDIKCYSKENGQCLLCYKYKDMIK